MRLNALPIAALSAIAICTQAWGFADAAASPGGDPAPVAVSIVPAQQENIVVEVNPRTSITLEQRLAWFDRKSFGIYNLAGAIPGAAINTLRDAPYEAGPHFEGFGERYGVTVSTNALSNAMEAGFGAMWGEDPRYYRLGPEAPVRQRIGHILKLTVLAPGRDGELHPAYARLIAATGASFISDGWREPSDTTNQAAGTRIGFAFLGRMSGNAFDEFWPDARRKLFSRLSKHN